MNVNVSNELNFSDVYRSVNYMLYRIPCKVYMNPETTLDPPTGFM